MTARYRNFILEPSRGFVFAYVPKVACTNWKALLRYMGGHADWLNNRLAHDRARSGLHHIDPEGPEAALLRRDDIPKYAMVRDPYARALSAYLNKVEDLLPPAPPKEGEDPFRSVVRDIEAFRAAHLADTHPRIDFEVFLRWLRDSRSPFTDDEHWVPQAVLLRQPELRFDMIGRFETLDEDAPRLLRAMGCDRDFPTQKDVRFAPTRAQEKLARYYTPTARALVEELFAVDFDTFDYPRRDPAASGSGTAGSTTPAPAPSSPTPQETPMNAPKAPAAPPPVIDTISENDWMWKANRDRAGYLAAGWSVGRTLQAAQRIADRPDPARILDFGCGHGRVMRWLRALYPQAHIVASDRVRDAVDFCAGTFDAEPVYSNDAYEDIPLGAGFDLIWLGSVYTHLPMRLWDKLTGMLVGRLAEGGMLAFSFAGPHVAGHLERGIRNANAEVAEERMAEVLRTYRDTGFGYDRHEGVGDREWGRSVISHARLFDFLHAHDLTVTLLGERLYDNWQDIVVARPRKD